MEQQDQEGVSTPVLPFALDDEAAHGGVDVLTPIEEADSTSFDRGVHVAEAHAEALAKEC